MKRKQQRRQLKIRKLKDKADQDLEDEGEDIPASEYVDANIDTIPPSKKSEVQALETDEIKDSKGVVNWMKRWRKKGEKGTAPEGWEKEFDGEGDNKKLKGYKQKEESKVLSFGEFITEGVMNDLLKAGKSKKDSEITLDDGADIPIDPLTSQILVKYIEGLSSSEKNRTIQQIQRTERAFMKVLGKAHENI